MVRAHRIVRVTQTIRADESIAPRRGNARRQDIAADLLMELGPLFAGEKGAFASHCHARSISMAHFFLMSMIDRHGAVPMTRVAELLGSGLPTATGLVSRMEERGLVRRDHDTKDRRVVLVSLTDAGAAEVRDLHETRQRRMAAAIAHLSATEQTGLLVAIRSLRSALERVNEGDFPR
jgi:DNA-binding MarR family transcriptional regulator